MRAVNDYEGLYSLDLLGVQDHGESDQLDVMENFKVNIKRGTDGRYEVGVSWIQGSTLTSSNEEASRERLQDANKRLKLNVKLKEEYETIVQDQLRDGIIERDPEQPSGDRISYMPHKPVVRDSAATTKVRMVFDASAKPHHLANSISECMHRGTPLQPLLWDILVSARMSPNILVGDIEKGFLQISINKEDRDAFRFLFKLEGQDQHFRFTGVPFGVEASPFMLGATLQNHYDVHPQELRETVETLQENTFVDNLIKTGHYIEDMENFKEENMPNPAKILGHTWDRREDTLEIQVRKSNGESTLTKRTILAQLGRVYYPLGIISPSMVKGKRIYRDACDERKGWNAEVSPSINKDWSNSTRQLRDVKVTRSLIKESASVEAVEIHQFADE